MENNKPENKEPWWREEVVMFAKVSAYIAFPIITALILGKYLDSQFGTSPWIFLSLTFLAFPISLLAIWKGLTSYLKKLEDETKEKK